MAADIPIRQVILYKSGVGYFERAGDLRAGESARLDFKASDMNDVLKSLTIEDRGGGKVTSLRYDSSEPLDQKLAEFPFHVEGQQSLSAFLDQVKGAQVELKYGAETITGTIVSARAIAAQEKTPEREQLVLLMDSGDIRTLDLAAATSIRFADTKLQAQLKDYLAIVNQARSKEKRSVYIDSTDAKQRQILASYMLPSPVWKSSYRLIFAGEGEPSLEGWAIVDNTTGEDWTNVRLAVVSGRPVSFISKLYDAKYLERPTVDLPEDRAQGPVVHEGAFAASTGSVMGQIAPAPPPMPMAMAPGSGGGMGGGAYRLGARQGVASSVAVATDTRDLGELFEYSFSSPVTVKKSESAMLPFLQQKLSTRKLLIYAETYGANPMSAAELTNSTGKTLDGGPITVFDSNSYAGEALMETLRAGDKRLISYAVDLGTRITTQFDSTHDTIREVHLSRGVLTSKSAAEETKTYTIRNVDSKPKTLLVEHPARPGYKLLNQKPTETTANAWRFEVKVAPNSTQKFAVAEEREYFNTLTISNLTPDVLLTYVQNKAISDAARRQLQQILDQKRQIAATQQQIDAANTSVKDITNDEDRVRKNIEALRNVSGQQEQVQKYSRQLGDQETQIAALRDQLNDLQKRKTAQEAALSALFEKLEF